MPTFEVIRGFNCLLTVFLKTRQPWPRSSSEVLLPQPYRVVLAGIVFTV